ncbi:MAG: prepilin-type N-terminal cleavage/methylation domain-containing protein [Eubacterium sp.]|nr:prepilin-type N-terminal cleavage/methylation domain-containing protein [Eubacterium sp.]
MRKNNGFTMVELVIVIAIIAILAAAIAPALYRYIDDSRKADDVESAGVIASAVNVALSDEDAFDAVMAASHTSDGKWDILLMAKSGDTEWTLRNGVDPDGSFKKIMDETCPPPPVKYRREIDPSLSANASADYASTADRFTPDGWAVCLVNNKPCVLISDGSTDPGTAPKAIALNPIMCSEYK